MSNAATRPAARDAASEIAHLGLRGVSTSAYIISELRRSLADMPRGNALRAAKAIADDFGLELDPEILLAAARA